MGLCRFLPTPSDRMGLLWSLLSVKGSIVLEYGPAGTTHYSMGFLGKLGVEQEEQLFTTHMSEDDVIMGDVSRLENSIVELDESYSPKVIFVVASSTSEVIGTDIKGVCRYMQPEVNAKLIPCDVGGFRGDYTVGVAFAYNHIVKNLTAPTDEVKNNFNLLGLSVGNYRAHSDKHEVIRLLKEGFNLETGAVLCCETSVSQIEQMSSAKINIVVGYEAIKTAQYLEKKFGTPYIVGMPYGYTGTKKWLEQIGEVLEQAPDATLMKEIDSKISDTSFYKMYGRMFKKAPKACIVGDYDRVVGLSTLMEDFGATVENKISLHTLKAVKEEVSDISYFENEGEKMQALESISDTFLLADEISIMLANDTNKSMCVNSPTVYKTQTATHLPIVGVRGTDMIREAYDEYIRTL
ncbi:MAG: hypothetical protein ATN36_00040 [Epulopiscium sp. Nele67-Bin005]|nr:MAG: hypothetical protein ATN36_00040 [Epulopiscium sp. Nele67-Bin005]